MPSAVVPPELVVADLGHPEESERDVIVSAMPPLRSLSAEKAIELAVQEAERLDMRLEVDRISAAWPLEVSHLMRDGVEVASGCGKGKGPEGIAGAHFEALERYYMSAQCNRRLAPGVARLRTMREVAEQVGVAGDLVIQRLAGDFPGCVAACVIHSNAVNSVWYPIFLTEPNYYRQPLPGDSVKPYWSMIRYSSSLGNASGSNTQEAYLAGLLELIEHDALSHALLQWFITRIPQADYVDIGSLPADVKHLHRIASEAVGAEVLLLDVTTDIGVPVYLAVGEGSDTEPAPLGIGASLIGKHATARALSELIQAVVLLDSKATARQALTRLAPWPALQECLMISRKRLTCRRSERVRVRGDVGDTATVQSSLATVNDLLSRDGIQSYFCEITPPQSLISVVSVIAPGLERFSLVRMGLPVIPTGRGWSRWQAIVAGHHPPLPV
jgi:ribosomal protein S12 methylthiotransferase accessory factor